MIRRAALTILIPFVGLLACARSQFWVHDAECGVEAGCAPTNWGDFAATLDVPECPSSNPVLTVNTTADELDGGQSITDPSQAGDYLSFAEAIWIAANRGTPHSIYFDAEMFPVATPGVIRIRDFYEMPARAPGLCIDGRRRGVEIEYDQTLATSTGSICVGNPGNCTLPLQQGALLVGIVFHGGDLVISDSVVAGCHIDRTHHWSTNAYNSEIGQGNVLYGVDIPVTSLITAADSELRGNYFGYDPVRRALLDGGESFDVWSAVEIQSGGLVADNVFCVDSLYTIDGGVPYWESVLFESNYFGVGGDGAPIPGCRWSLDIAMDGPLRVGPGNVVRGLARDAVTMSGGDSNAVELTRNVITGNAGGIRVLGGGDGLVPSAPAITQATRTLVTGECAQSGRIEVFSDPGDQGETFLGETSCTAGVPWSVSVSTVVGRNATATLTTTATDLTAYVRTSMFSEPVPIQ